MVSEKRRATFKKASAKRRSSLKEKGKVRIDAIIDTMSDDFLKNIKEENKLPSKGDAIDLLCKRLIKDS